MPSSCSYFQATRHPWPCLLFLVPLLLSYEGGVLWLNAAHPEAVRNGADTWFRWGLEAFGLEQMYAAPALILVVLLGWSLVRMEDRPDDFLSIWTGMVVESVLFAVGLWGISRGLRPFLFRLGVELTLPSPGRQVAGQIITFVGAGIYEEMLFRLVLFAGLRWLLEFLGAPPPLPFLGAAAVSATLFSAAHHLGPQGEVFIGYVYLFRTLAGLYFACVFQLRGFGVAVGAHALYDVLVGAGVG
jgi:membrane protease YdiL (CAAX protease family)